MVPLALVSRVGHPAVFGVVPRAQVEVLRAAAAQPNRLLVEIFCALERTAAEANVSVIALPPANLPFSGKTSADQDRVVPSHVPTSKNPKNPTIVKRPTSCRASPNTSMNSPLVHV